MLREKGQSGRRVTCSERVPGEGQERTYVQATESQALASRGYSHVEKILPLSRAGMYWSLCTAQTVISVADTGVQGGVGALSSSGRNLAWEIIRSAALRLSTTYWAHPVHVGVLAHGWKLFRSSRDAIVSRDERLAYMFLSASEG